ncbi:sperm flagellar protein 1-like [Phymastichus coffea]|uniref:sperm flagellar protein 1-like n=1 Tax=Phymastichus coffea TaxID=108790 RepID=UPI00273C9D99|nr:sperm flagellar protein 1-like [Phymastichus coffea]
MSLSTGIDDDHVGDLYAWLDEIPLSRPKRNVARDFSDGVLMAELLKRYYPRYVDVKNYIAASSMARKVDNWSTLNRKVFPKIHLKLSKETINRLAQSHPGIIEKLLLEVRSKIVKDCNADRDSLFKGIDDPESRETIKSITSPEESLNQTIPRKVFIKVKKDLEEKTETIHILIKKIEHLETMIRFKDQRIEDLMTQIQSYIEKP